MRLIVDIALLRHHIFRHDLPADRARDIKEQMLAAGLPV
jgi:hypothetical protein